VVVYCLGFAVLCLMNVEVVGILHQSRHWWEITGYRAVW